MSDVKRPLKIVFVQSEQKEMVWLSDYETLLAQLPEEMQSCTIRFKECKKGHGWLTATNWIQHDCQVCKYETAESQLREAGDWLRALLEWIDAVPDEAQLPAMPGIDRDDLEQFLSTLPDSNKPADEGGKEE